MTTNPDWLDEMQQPTHIVRDAFVGGLIGGLIQQAFTRRKQQQRPVVQPVYIRHHKGWSHGLPPGYNADINCTSCRSEHERGIQPYITEYRSAL